MVEIWGKEKYIIKEGFIEKRIEKRKYLGENKKREVLNKNKESEQCNFLYNLSLLRQACEGIYALLSYKINLFFSIYILEQSPLLLFVTFSYKFY